MRAYSRRELIPYPRQCWSLAQELYWTYPETASLWAYTHCSVNVGQREINPGRKTYH